MDVEPLLIAVAATSAAGKGAWVADLLKGVLPVVTLVVGWGLKWLQDNYTESKKQAAEAALRREQRLELLTARRLDTERENLLKVQDILGLIARTHTLLYLADERIYKETGKWGETSVDREVAEKQRVAFQQLLPIKARLHSRDIAEAIDSTTGAMGRSAYVKDAKEAEQIWRSSCSQCFDVQQRIGDRIREIESEGLHSFLGSGQNPTDGQ